MGLTTIVFVLNATLLLLHEIESSYEREWEILKLPGRITGFLILHIPLILILFYGALEIEKQSQTGFILGIIFGVGGLIPFIVHKVLKKVEGRFNLVISNVLIYLNIVTGLILLILSISLFSFSITSCKQMPPRNPETPMITHEDFYLYYGQTEVINVNGQVNEDLLKNVIDDIVITEAKISTSPYVEGYRKDIVSSTLTAVVVGDEKQNYYRLLGYSTKCKEFKTIRDVSVGDPIELIIKEYPGTESYNVESENGITNCYKFNDGNEFGYSIVFLLQDDIIQEIVVQKSDP